MTSTMCLENLADVCLSWREESSPGPVLRPTWFSGGSFFWKFSRGSVYNRLGENHAVHRLDESGGSRV